MAVQKKRNIRFSTSPIKKKVKMGGRTVVSEALVKQDASNLTPKIHVKRGDLVMVISGNKKYKGKTGKVLQVFPALGKVTVEGINVITKAVRPRTQMGKSGLVQEEAPIFASKVMLYNPETKKPVRKEFRKKLGLE